MVKYGVVKDYNGRFGYILSSDNQRFDFSKEDISLNTHIKVNDYVVFRGEEKDKKLKLARNVARTDYRIDYYR